MTACPQPAHRPDFRTPREQEGILVAEPSYQVKHPSQAHWRSGTESLAANLLGEERVDHLVEERGCLLGEEGRLVDREREARASHVRQVEVSCLEEDRLG